MNALLQFLFGCAHQQVSWPQKRNGRTYICCLACGKEFDYDWRRMKAGEARKLVIEVPAPELAEAELERLFTL